MMNTVAGRRMAGFFVTAKDISVSRSAGPFEYHVRLTIRR
jgi:hypothetical protein